MGKLVILINKFLSKLNILKKRVDYIGGNDVLPPPLKKEEEEDLVGKLSTEGEKVRNILIERNLRLVVYIARKFENTGVAIEDLISVGTIGLIKAVNTFNPEKKIKLATYASRCIENEILMHLRSIKKLGAEVYLDDPIGKDKDDNTVTLQEVLENNDKSIEDSVDLKFKVKKLYEKMKEVLKLREKTILELRFGLDGNKPKTQNQIAEMMGISRSYVSRIETKAIDKLSKEFKE